MAMITQMSIFDNTENFDSLGDLERVRMIIDNIPDEIVLDELRKHTDYRGRKGAGLEVLINILWTQKVLQHTTISETLRELRRNSQLRKLIGIRNEIVPSNSAITRFINKLKIYQIDLKEIFYKQRDVLMKLLPDYGKDTGADGKYLDSYARRENKHKKADGRRDTDAKYGIKEKYYKDSKGNEKIKKETHFGYRLHLLADVNYELPMDYELTTANNNEGKELDKILNNKRNKMILNKTNTFIADKGYDNSKRILKLESMGILPIIDKRVQCKEEKKIKQTVYYDDCGNVNCYCPVTGEKRGMAFNGYDKRRDTLSYKCPAKAYGIECKGCETHNCPVKTVVKIKRKVNLRVFTQIARDSYKWKRYYNKRTALERINSRIDVGYKFENHTIRGIDKMKVSVDIAMIVMTTIAIENIKLGKLERIRSLTKCA